MSNNAKIREEAKKLNPIDDLMFRKLAEDKEFCQEILRIILDDNELIVTDVEPQWPGSNLKGRSVILDAKCLKGDGQSIDIEVQKADDDDHQRRVRYNGAILTTNTTDTGTKFKQIPDVTVVFISKFDIFEESLPLYHIDRVIRETGKVVDNGFYEVYVNAQIKDGSDVAELMEVFTIDNAYNNKFPRTSEAKHRYKETEAGLDIMCEIMEKLTTDAREEGRLEGIAEGKLEGIAEGKTKGKIETLISLVANQTLSVTDAANFANMSVQNFSDLMTQR